MLMLQAGNSGQTPLADQFKRMSLTSKNISDEMYSIAANKENIAKNRDSSSLPRKSLYNNHTVNLILCLLAY